MLSARCRHTMLAAACVTTAAIFTTACTSDSPCPPATTGPGATRPAAATTTVAPRTIHPAAGAPTGATPAADDATRLAWVHYRWAGPDIALPTVGDAFTYTGEVTPAGVARLAAAFGLTADPVLHDVGDGGGWTVGANDGSGATLWVASDPLGEWNYSPAMTVGPCTVATAGGEGATAVGGGDTGDGTTPAVSGPATGAGSSILPGDVIASGPDATTSTSACNEPTPALPSAATLIAQATARFRAAGLAASLVYEADLHSGSVTAAETVGGIRSPFTDVISFAPDGTVQWASGHLGTPVPAGTYPLVDVASAIARANTPPASVARGADPAAGLPAPADDTPAPSPAPPATSSTDDPGMATSEPTLLPAPETDPTGEPFEITLTAVTVGLTPIWDTDGTVWLVPAYELSNGDGAMVTVPAVTDTYLDRVPAPDPGANTATSSATPGAPADPVPPAATGPTSVMPAVVGLDEAAARHAATAAGWSFRVVRVDGEDQMVTADYSDTRLGATLEHGIVVAVTVG